MNNLYEALEMCLNEIEQGDDMDIVLLHYPELADELRPILEVSAKAKAMAVPAPSHDLVLRNRAKLLQRAYEIREVKNAPASRRLLSVPLRSALVSLVVIAMLLISSTGLVRASSNTLPGDNLYPVKRTWEGMLVFFTLDSTKREELELQQEYERLDELHELFAEGRSAYVDFSGYVSYQNETEWRVASITILITPDTLLPEQSVEVGAAVRVIGKVQNSLSVNAERIEILPPDSIVPEVDDNELDEQIKEDPGSESKPESTVVPSLKTPTPVFERKDLLLEGAVVSIENNFIVVNGILMDIRFVEIKGMRSVGVFAKVEGYYDASGVFIVTKIEFRAGGSNGGSGSGNDNPDNNNRNDNGDDDGNDNSNDDNSNDNGGNSGPGGGGDD